MGKKDDKIKELEEVIVDYQEDIEFLERRISELVDKIALQVLPEPASKKKYGGSLVFDFWPPRDWFRFSINKWGPGKYFQLCVGPIRLDFWQD